jgi:hypothetical protein
MVRQFLDGESHEARVLFLLAHKPGRKTGFFVCADRATVIEFTAAIMGRQRLNSHILLSLPAMQSVETTPVEPITPVDGEGIASA